LIIASRKRESHIVSIVDGDERYAGEGLLALRNIYRKE
jgi:hypothetical protein